MQEMLRQYPGRGTWTSFTSFEPNIKSDIYIPHQSSEVLDVHKLVLISFTIQTNDEELDYTYHNGIPNKLNNPCEHRFLAGSSKCSTKF